MKASTISGLKLLGVLAVISQTPGAFALTEKSSNTAPAQSAPAGTFAEPRYSAGIADIIKMVDAKVDKEVIKTFVKNSTVPYNPSASELVMLKEKGVPDDVLTAVIQRGGEVRGQLAQAVAPQATAPPPAQAPNTYAAPAYPPASGSAYPNYDMTDSLYSYPYYGYSYPYYYPTYSYWWYNYGYPWGYYWPYYYAGYGCYPYRYGYYCGYPGSRYYCNNGHWGYGPYNGNYYGRYGGGTTANHGQPYWPKANTTGRVASVPRAESAFRSTGGMAGSPAVGMSGRPTGFSSMAPASRPAPVSSYRSTGNAGFRPTGGTAMMRSAPSMNMGMRSAPSVGMRSGGGGMAMRSGGGGMGAGRGGGGGGGGRGR